MTSFSVPSTYTSRPLWVRVRILQGVGASQPLPTEKLTHVWREQKNYAHFIAWVGPLTRKAQAQCKGSPLGDCISVHTMQRFFYSVNQRIKKIEGAHWTEKKSPSLFSWGGWLVGKTRCSHPKDLRAHKCHSLVTSLSQCYGAPKCFKVNKSSTKK